MCYNDPDDPLTAALLGSIPRDEMHAQRQERLALEAEARRISDEIDNCLRQERLERGRKKVVKILLLGWSPFLGRRSPIPFQTTSCKFPSIQSLRMRLARTNALYPFIPH